ncbi:MAG: response regulator [Selenomonas sp.]|jgi:putative two-component system response regulator|nr:response regulator [Selenomonas sp.]
MERTKARILVVDDVLANRKLAGKILAEEFEVDSVKSGEEALDFFTRKIPDLVLLDIHMEGIDGFEVLERMKAVPETAQIPVIFLTADDDHEAETKGFSLGALDFITKPFIATIMRQRVRRTVELSHLRKQLRAEVAAQTQRIQQISLQLIQVLANTIEARDKGMKGHSSRVADYAWQIAQRLGTPAEQREDIYYMGLLHNIGRIAIPDEILNLKGELDDIDREVVQQSTVIGGEILKSVTELPHLWEGAKYHHEKYDGTGYPDGLKGEEIPKGARIIAMACCYDSLKSAPGNLSREQRKAAVEAERGKRFDPEIVDVMLKLIEEEQD